MIDTCALFTLLTSRSGGGAVPGLAGRLLSRSRGSSSGSPLLLSRLRSTRSSSRPASATVHITEIDTLE